ncbi:acyltransferase family protein [Hyphomonas sp. GM-8P]|uniref:acyltransferase family protein n=1 Tax=Hyphomonas sp. GM-8P TaxID=1280945 RepID=UPI000DC00BB2|nr:acyltransferase family protein [Hyphomonas sp. GM-8P]RAN41094.1 hypothetical protein HY26_10625 [Hyphomonas sp. GM-8P]
MNEAETMRYLGIDLARSVAIFFVMMGHAMAAARIGHGIPGIDALRIFLSISAPVFFCLFGTMLQLVYTRKYASGLETETTQRLWTRALQCWILYAFTCAVFCLANGYSLAYFVRCSLFMGDTPYTDILRFYAAQLFLAPLLVRTSARIGLWPLVLTVAVIHASFPFISQLGPIGTFPGAESISSFVYGGNLFTHTGPSVIHGLGFVVAGMVIGKVMQARPGKEALLSGPGWRVRTAYVALALVCLGWMVFAGYNMADPQTRTFLRNANHPLYLLTGVAATVLFIDVFGIIRSIAKTARDSIWMIFGRTSLFTFAYGNAYLYIVALKGDTPGPAFTQFFVSMVVILLMSYGYSRFRDMKALKSDHWMARTYRWIVDDSTPQIVRFLTGPILHHDTKSSQLPTMGR